MEEKYKDFFEGIRAKGYEDTGWQNGWGKEHPAVHLRCKELGHWGVEGNPHRFGASKNMRGSEELGGCHTCRYYYRYDCSD